MKNLIIIMCLLNILSCKKDQRKSSIISKEISINKNQTQNIWNGKYSVHIDYGKLDEFSESTIDYDIQITENGCTFSGLGYKTYFTDKCKVIEDNKTLILKYEKNIDGDGFSDHSKINNLGTIIFKNNKYYIKSPIIADKNWNYNVEILLDKK